VAGGARCGVADGTGSNAWVAWSPQSAWAEIVARRSPLFAYLARSPASNGHGSGFAIEPNTVFLEGTERTAQAAFGYRLGMTMADWACRGLMGLGPTNHAETAPPRGAGGGWTQAPGLPDLTGVHAGDKKTWLIEAKGGRKVGLWQLRKGAQQLSQSGVMIAPHVRVLSGASVEHRLIVTLDIENWSPRSTAGSMREIQEGDDYLLDNTRSRMLSFYALSALNPSDRAALPVGSTVAERVARPGLLSPLEDEPSTGAARSRARRQPLEPCDMLVGQIPNTDLFVGLSRRQYGACRALASAQRQLLPEDNWLADPQRRAQMLDLDSEQMSRRVRERNVSFHIRVQRERAQLASVARDGFTEARDMAWESVLGDPVREIRSLPGQFVEAATEDTYLALDARSL
jgi:hypothetical protein